MVHNITYYLLGAATGIAIGMGGVGIIDNLSSPAPSANSDSACEQYVDTYRTESRNCKAALEKSAEGLTECAEKLSNTVGVLDRLVKTSEELRTAADKCCDTLEKQLEQ